MMKVPTPCPLYHSSVSAKLLHSWHGCLRQNRLLNFRRERPLCATVAASSFQGCQTGVKKQAKIVGLGSCGLDYLASVAKFPSPDDKLRTDKLETQGGGNCGNALTTVVRLGLPATIISKVGADAVGDGIIREFESDGVDTKHIFRHPGSPSPFTYIIVERAGGTRTCIHTPGAPLHPDELTTLEMDEVLDGAALVYFDGRLTETALKLARHARAKGIPVLVEAERLRPNLELLLAEADYIVTSAHFPQDFTGEADLGDAILATSLRLPRARFVLTTLGSQGSVLIEQLPTVLQQQEDRRQPRLSDPGDDGSSTAVSVAGGQPRTGAGSSGSNTGGCGEATQLPFKSVRSAQPLAEVLALLQREAVLTAQQPSPVVCMSSNGVAIRAGSVSTSHGPVMLGFSTCHSAEASISSATAAASHAAVLNADPHNAAGYAAVAGTAGVGAQAQQRLAATVAVASAASLPKGAIIDTTGAGDSFIGSVLYSLAVGLNRHQMLRLASVVAACKCTALGARAGLPRRKALAGDLLEP